MITVLLVYIGVLCLVYYVIGGKVNELSSKIPSGFRRWPIIGHAYMFTGGGEGMMVGLNKFGMDAISHGGLSTLWLGNNYFLMVADPISAQTLLKNCLEKQETTRKIFEFFIGNGSLYAKVPTWRSRRKVLAPTFSVKRLNRFVDVFASQSEILVQKLQPTAGKGTFPLWKYLTTYTFDAVCETTLGILKTQDNPYQTCLEYLEKINETIAQRLLRPWLQSDIIYRFLSHYRNAKKCKNGFIEFIDMIIATKRKETAEKQMKPGYTDDPDAVEFKSLVEMLLEETEARKRFSDEQIREEALVMTAAGTDTSAVGTCFTLVMLSRHPEIQDKVVNELQEVLDNKSPVTAADLPKLKYLELVIKESLRLYPPVPAIVRTTSNQIELIPSSGIVLPEGTDIVVNIWAIHRNPRYWGPDADEFKPERFFDPLVHSEQFIPFSHGLRNCLGYQYAMMSMKTVLATVLRSYRVLPPKEMDEMALKEPIPVSFDIMQKAVDRFSIQLENRETIHDILPGN